MPPGKEGKIELAVEHTDGYVGEVAKSASVTTNDPKNAQFNLILRARFKAPPAPPAAAAAAGSTPPQMRLAHTLLVEPADRWISSVLTGSNATTTLFLYNTKDDPIRVRQIVLPGTDFTAKLQPIQDGKRYEVYVATNPALKPGYYKQTLRVITDSATEPEVPIELELNVYPKVFVTPTAIMMPALPTGSEVSWPPVYLRKMREAGLKIKSVSSTLDFIKIEVNTETEGQVYKLKLTLDREKVKPGAFKGIIRIETNDPEMPSIEVPIQGSFT